jgi:hypothetical protein
MQLVENEEGVLVSRTNKSKKIHRMLHHYLDGILGK